MPHRLLLCLFATFGFFNLGFGALLVVEKILNSFKRKPGLWMWVYLVVTAAGIVAIRELLAG